MEVELSRPLEPRRRRTGYTLPELLLGLAITVILMAWGVPAFVRLYQENALTAETNTLLSALSRARSEAIRANRPAVICRSTDSRTCLSGGPARSDWSSGWLVFINSDGDKNRDPGEPVLLVNDGRASQVSLYFNNWWRLTYHPTGSSGNGSFTLCHRGGGGRVITVYRTSRHRVSTPARSELDDVCPS